ncbi:hypothetical protein HaLaN_11278 [Haematococcus lacustris]|uniref:Uncharacterized protein n=1 Tax=Haematococcus lacustris TaxID=44745 RepID=A0A699YZI2_HAELA|nr:hypothetical protein HaLaN_11278 [Haematococcus lacustris]
MFLMDWLINFDLALLLTPAILV